MESIGEACDSVLRVRDMLIEVRLGCEVLIKVWIYLFLIYHTVTFK